jgi:HK97 family phage portal protein
MYRAGVPTRSPVGRDPRRTPHRLARPAAERRSYSISDPALVAMLGYGVPGTPSVSEHTALTLSGVYRAVSLISGAIASLPLRTLARSAGGTQVRANSFLDSPGMDRLTPFEWKELVVRYLLLHGAAPLQHIYGGGGQLVGLNPLHPLGVEVDADDARPGGRRFTVRPQGQAPRTFDATTMTYVMGPSLDGVMGISPITAARLSMGTGLAGERTALRMHTNGAQISGVITPKDDNSLMPDDAKALKEIVDRSIVGTDNAGDVVVLNRALDFKPWQMSAVDSQFLQSRTFSIDEVGRWFGVPPHLLGLTEKSTSWGRASPSRTAGLHRYTLSPWTERIQDRLSPLVSARKSVEFDYAGFLASSPQDEIELLIAQVNAGLLTLNEARRIRNLPALPADTGADLPRYPAGSNDPRDAPTGPTPTPGGAA